jgi:hypothetical protein
MLVSRTGRLYPQECSWYSFSLGAESTPGPWYGRKEHVIEKSSDITGNRSRDRATSGAAKRSTWASYSGECNRHSATKFSSLNGTLRIVSKMFAIGVLTHSTLIQSTRSRLLRFMLTLSSHLGARGPTWLFNFEFSELKFC